MAILSNPLAHAFGLDIGDRSFKLIQLKARRNKKKNHRLMAWGSVDVPEGVMERGEIMDMDKAVDLLKQLLKTAHGHVQGRAVAVCLPEARSFVKIIEVDSHSGNEQALHGAVLEEIQQNIPLPIDEIYYDWQIVPDETDKDVPLPTPVEEKPATTDTGSEKDAGDEEENEGEGAEAEVTEPEPPKRTTVLLAAAPKDLVENYVKMLEAAGLIPIVLEIEATAVTRAIVPLRKMADVSLGILDIGATRSSLVIYDRGALQMSISIPISGIEITKIVSEKLKLSMDEAEDMKKDCGLDVKKCGDKMWNVLLPIIDDMTDRIRNALRFYRIGFPNGRMIDQIYLCGGGAHFKEIDTVLSRKLTMKSRLANSLVNLDPKLPRKFPKEKALTYTTAIGLALRASVEHVHQKDAR